MMHRDRESNRKIAAVLGIGASYLYAIFVSWGIITEDER